MMLNRGLGATKTLAQYIAQMEGYSVAGSLAQRNNNPGNLRDRPAQYGPWPGQTGTSGGFAVFESPEAGWNALDIQIRSDANRGLTLQQFIYKYAPPSENDSANYLNFVARNLGVSTDTPLAQVAPIGSGYTLEPSSTGEALSEAETVDAEPSEEEGTANRDALLLLTAAGVAALALLQ